MKLLFVATYFSFQVILAQQLTYLLVHVAQKVHVAVDAIRAAIFDQEMSKDTFELVALADECDLFKFDYNE